MAQKIDEKQEKQFLTSVRLPKHLHERIELKSVELGDIGVSETIRILLSWSLENPQSDFLAPPKEHSQPEINSKIQNKILEHVVTLYYLLKEQVVDSGENGVRAHNAAHERAKIAIDKILERRLCYQTNIFNKVKIKQA